MSLVPIPGISGTGTGILTSSRDDRQFLGLRRIICPAFTKLSTYLDIKLALFLTTHIKDHQLSLKLS